MKLRIIKDVNDNPYIGVIVNDMNLDFKNLLKLSFKTIDDFAAHNNRLLLRNNNHYHITVFNAMECSKFPTLLFYNDVNIYDIKLKGVGSIKQKKMETYFIPCVSTQLNDLLKSVDLKPKDFHITIGFTDKDLFGQRKNESNII